MQSRRILAFPSFYFQTVSDTVRGEVVRKSIHMMVSLVPLMASYNKTITLGLLALGTLVYTYAEFMRCRGLQISFISRITAMASRDKELGHFVLGPVTLGIGAMMALLLYPAEAATIGIYALAFGDGVASLVGRLFGKIRIPGTGGKTIIGSLACFSAIYISTFAVCGNLGVSLGVAFIATAVEMIPLRDFDNILMPLSAGTAFLLLI